MVRRHSSCFGLAAVAAAALVACGGGGGSAAGNAGPSAADTSSHLAGTAAYGAPMAQAKITIVDVNGKTVIVDADASGNYKADVTGLTAPLLVTATANSGDAVRVYHALVSANVAAGATDHANVTHLTDAIVALASSDGSTPAEFSNLDKLKGLDPAKLQKATDLVKAILKDVATALGAANYDPVTSTFTADGTSSGDKLLDMVKLSIDQNGITLRIVWVPTLDSASGAPSNTVVTVKDTSTTTTAPSLTPPTITDNATVFDTWVAEVNKCLALVPAQRVSVDASGAPSAFLGDCAKVSGFASNYKRNGYTLLQYWGGQLRSWIPDGAVMGKPQVLAFLKNAAGEDIAIVRLSYDSPKGGGSYFETARKVSGVWFIEGNQRKYDASISVRALRITDRSTYPYTPPFGPDQGKNVGWFNAYSSRIHMHFNQGGPNASDVYAVRVTGPGLPASGVVLARSSSCGTDDYLAFYSNDGSLPPAPALGTTVMPLATNLASNAYVFGATPDGGGYTGSDFYNEWRGRNSDGSPTTSKLSNVAPAPGIDLSTIPELAKYTFEVFKAGSSAVADTFTVRAITRPVSSGYAAKLPWASASADMLKYVNPANTALAGELDGAQLSWTIPAGAPPVTYAYLYGQGYDSTNVFRRMNLGGYVNAVGDTSLALSTAAERNGNGAACSYAKVPAFGPSKGYREVGTRQITVEGLYMVRIDQHLARTAPTN